MPNTEPKSDTPRTSKHYGDFRSGAFDRLFETASGLERENASLKSALKEAKEATGVIRFLENIASLPGSHNSIHISNSKDMGYETDFISVWRNSETSETGNSVLAALTKLSKTALEEKK
jgi:hypothetical protein